MSETKRWAKYTLEFKQVHMEDKLFNLGLREVPSTRIGELVMRELKKLDKVAYVRFASVYRSFEDIDEFKTLVDEVRRQDIHRYRPSPRPGATNGQIS